MHEPELTFRSTARPSGQPPNAGSSAWDRPWLLVMAGALLASIPSTLTSARERTSVLPVALLRRVWCSEGSEVCNSSKFDHLATLADAEQCRDLQVTTLNVFHSLDVHGNYPGIHWAVAGDAHHVAIGGPQVSSRQLARRPSGAGAQCVGGINVGRGGRGGSSAHLQIMYGSQTKSRIVGQCNDHCKAAMG